MVKNPAERIDDRIDKKLKKVWNSIPAKIAKVHNNELKVDVFFKVKWTRYPIYIEKVRLLYPQGKGAKILFNVSKGDTVLLLFTKYMIDVLKTEQIYYVNEDSSFNITDVIALPGFTLDVNLDEEFHGQNISIPNGIKIVSDDEVLVSAKSFKYHDGTDTYEILTEAALEGNIKYFEQDTEPDLNEEEAAIWTDTTNENVWFLTKTSAGQKGVELG